MTDIGSRVPRRRPGYAWLAVGPVAAAGAIAMFIAAQPAVAATTPVNLGSDSSFAVLAGTTVTNTGASIINGDLGLAPGSAVTGFPPGIVNGTIHVADGVAVTAKSDLVKAYNDAAGRSPTPPPVSTVGSGTTLTPGVYSAPSTLEVKGALTLDGGGDPNAVFIFQVPKGLTADSNSTVILTDDAQACNVFWQVGSSATLGTNATFVGSVLALTSITVDTGDTVAGRVLARNGAVTLDDDTITAPTTCNTTSPTPTPTATTPTPTPTATTPTPTPTATTPTPTPSLRGGSPTATPTPTLRGGSPTATPTTPTATPTTPTPTPTPTSPTPGPAPVPAPVGNNFPVTG